MNFIDTAWIEVKAGDGGAGHISFRREKYVPKGGPDGGNGGNGGSVYVEADQQLGTLLDFRYTRIYKAKAGARGGQSNCTGKSGDDIIIRVPAGTVVRDRETGALSKRGGDILAHTPAGRFGTPDDLMGALLWLVSPAAAFVTGTVVVVDGGFSAFSGV